MLESERQAKEQELIQTLDELCALLRQHGESGWATHFENARDRLTMAVKADWSREARALECKQLRKAFGGMGSFNDLVICPQNRHAIENSLIKPVNDHLQHLGSRVWQLSHMYEEGTS